MTSDSNNTKEAGSQPHPQVLLGSLELYGANKAHAIALTPYPAWADEEGLF